jgi:hypothetical protein
MPLLRFVYSSSLILTSCLILSACETPQASGPASDPAYVSEAQYSGYTCRQIHAEMNRVSRHLEAANQANGANQILGAAVAAFAISRGYGISGDDSGDVELRRFRNQYDVLEQLSIKKDCRI